MRPYLAVLLLVVACSSQGGNEPPADAAKGMQGSAMPDAHVPVPDAPTATVCAVKDPVVQLIYTCDFQWKQCSGTSTADHEIDCQIQTAGTLRFSLCDCKVNGASQKQFTSTTICASASWPELETTANMQCDWNLQ